MPEMRFSPGPGLVDEFIADRLILMASLETPDSLVGWEDMSRAELFEAVHEPDIPETVRADTMRYITRTALSVHSFFMRREQRLGRLAETYESDLAAVRQSAAHALAQLGFEKSLVTRSDENDDFAAQVAFLRQLYGDDAVRVVRGDLYVNGGEVVYLPPAARTVYVWRHAAVRE